MKWIIFIATLCFDGRTTSISARGSPELFLYGALEEFHSGQGSNIVSFAYKSYPLILWSRSSLRYSPWVDIDTVYVGVYASEYYSAIRKMKSGTER